MSVESFTAPNKQQGSAPCGPVERRATSRPTTRSAVAFALCGFAVTLLSVAAPEPAAAFGGFGFGHMGGGFGGGGYGGGGMGMGMHHPYGPMMPRRPYAARPTGPVHGYPGNGYPGNGEGRNWPQRHPVIGHPIIVPGGGGGP